MKAFLTLHQEKFTKTHELQILGGQCAAIDQSLKALTLRAESLTNYAWKFRYPGAPYEPTVEEAREALGTAQEVFDAILDRVPAEARS